MITLLQALWNLFMSRVMSLNSPIVAPNPVPVPIAEEEGTPPPPPPAPDYLFDTPQNTRHSIRVLCDEEGLALARTFNVDGRFYLPKDVLCACIEQESQFRNLRADGTPMRRRNYAKDGKTLLSTDWGLCQVNDTRGWHIGPGLAFPSVAYVVENPEKVVRWMIHMMKAGKLNLWVSYTSGDFKKYLPQN